MGGWGSGSWFRWDSKDTTDEHRELDIRSLHKRGALRPGYHGTYSWIREDEPYGSVGFHAQLDRIILSYRHRTDGGDWKSTVQEVFICYTPCHFGGKRPWFVCPAADCGLRVAVLYGAGRYFACRHCYDLAYQSQREDHLERLARKSRKIIRRLGGDPYENFYPDKPKGMHWKTYNKLVGRCRFYDELYEDLATSSQLHALARPDPIP